jgi:hypothetical protein
MGTRRHASVAEPVDAHRRGVRAKLPLHRVALVPQVRGGTAHVVSAARRCDRLALVELRGALAGVRPPVSGARDVAAVMQTDAPRLASVLDAVRSADELRVLVRHAPPLEALFARRTGAAGAARRRAMILRADGADRTHAGVRLTRGRVPGADARAGCIADVGARVSGRTRRSPAHLARRGARALHALVAGRALRAIVALVPRRDADAVEAERTRRARAIRVRLAGDSRIDRARVRRARIRRRRRRHARERPVHELARVSRRTAGDRAIPELANAAGSTRVPIRALRGLAARNCDRGRRVDWRSGIQSGSVRALARVRVARIAIGAIRISPAADRGASVRERIGRAVVASALIALAVGAARLAVRIHRTTPQQGRGGTKQRDAEDSLHGQAG